MELCWTRCPWQMQSFWMSTLFLTLMMLIMKTLRLWMNKWSLWTGSSARETEIILTDTNTLLMHSYSILIDSIDFLWWLIKIPLPSVLTIIYEWPVCHQLNIVRLSQTLELMALVSLLHWLVNHWSVLTCISTKIYVKIIFQP